MVQLDVVVRQASATRREASGTTPLASGNARQAWDSTRLASSNTQLAWGDTPPGQGHGVRDQGQCAAGLGERTPALASWPNGSSVVIQAWCVFGAANRRCRQSRGVLVQASRTDPKARCALVLATGVPRLTRHALTEARVAAGQAWLEMDLARGARA